MKDSKKYKIPYVLVRVSDLPESMRFGCVGTFTLIHIDQAINLGVPYDKS